MKKTKTTTTKTTRLLLGALAAILFGAAATVVPAAGAPPRVVILGFDGVDSQIVEQMLARGELPNLAELKARGGYSPLTPTIPAQTPVSWATFSTGLDPGGHEIFDFLKRDPSNRIPTFAVAEEITVPFLFGRRNPVVFAAAGALLFLLPALWLFLRNRRIAFVPPGRARRGGRDQRVPGRARLAAGLAAGRAQQPARPRLLGGGGGPPRHGRADARPRLRPGRNAAAQGLHAGQRNQCVRAGRQPDGRERTVVFDPRHLDRVFAVTNRLRTEGTDNLLSAGRAVGVRRFVAQSFAGWPFPDSPWTAS